MVRRQSAKLIFVGSIPARTYFYKMKTAKKRFLFCKNGRWQQHQLLGVASGIERRSDVRVLPSGKGEYREPGLQENSVRSFTGRRSPPAHIFMKIKPPKSGFCFGKTEDLRKTVINVITPKIFRSAQRTNDRLGMRITRVYRGGPFGSAIRQSTIIQRETNIYTLCLHIHHIAR